MLRSFHELVTDIVIRVLFFVLVKTVYCVNDGACKSCVCLLSANEIEGEIVFQIDKHINWLINVVSMLDLNELKSNHSLKVAHNVFLGIVVAQVLYDK